MKKETKKPNKKIITAKKSVKKDIIKMETDIKELKGKKISKTIKMHLLGLLVLIALLGGCFYKFGIVATVNGKAIYRWSYIKALQKNDSTVLNQIIQETLIEKEAKNKGITIDQKEIDESLAVIEDQVKTQGTTLEEALKSEGMTKEELISQIRTQKIAEKLASSNTEISQEQIDTFLKENKDYLPTDKTKEELQTLAKEQLESQAKNEALNTWYSNLKSEAKIIYR